MVLRTLYPRDRPGMSRELKRYYRIRFDKRECKCGRIMYMYQFQSHKSVCPKRF